MYVCFVMYECYVSYVFMSMMRVRMYIYTIGMYVCQVFVKCMYVCVSRYVCMLRYV